MRILAGPALLGLCALAAGCGTPTGGARRPANGLTREEIDFSRALAQYATGLQAEAEHGRGSAEALAAFREAARLDPGSLRIARLLARNLVQARCADEAVAVLQRVCDADPGSGEAHRDLAQAAEFAGQLDLAERAYGRAAALSGPEAGESLVRARIRVLFRAGRDREAFAAIAALPLVVAGEAKRPPPLFEYGLHFLGRRAQSQRAAACFDLAARQATNAWRRSDAYDLLSLAWQRAGDTNAALRACRQSIEANPFAFAAAYRLSGFERRRLGPSVTNLWQRATAASPPDIVSFLLLAGERSERRDRAGAADLLLRACRAPRPAGASPDIDLVLHLAAELDTADRDADAETVLRDGLRTHPDDPSILNHLAYLWAVNGVNLDEAERLVSRALAARPDEGAYVDTLGWVYYRQQRYAEALAKLARALAMEPDDPTILDHIGDTLVAMGREPEGLGFWMRSYGLDTETPGVAEKIRRRGIDPASLPRRGRLPSLPEPQEDDGPPVPDGGPPAPPPPPPPRDGGSLLSPPGGALAHGAVC
jgi:predicted Zn-dependent protease